MKCTAHDKRTPSLLVGTTFRLMSVLSAAALLAACAQSEPKTPVSAADIATPVDTKPAGPPVMPARYSQPTMIISDSLADHNDTNIDDELKKETKIRVGARIRSTNGPQPVWDIMKRLVALKKMSVSWADDVNRNLKVDVDIQPTDDFFDAIDNLLRQAGYTYEVKNNTVVVLNKVTRVYHIPMPNAASSYSTSVGGDFLSGDRTISSSDRSSSSNASGGGLTKDVEGIVKIESLENNFDIWDNIRSNLRVFGLVDQSAAAPAEMAETTICCADHGGLSSDPTQCSDGTPRTESCVDGSSSDGKQANAERSQTSSRASYFVVDSHLGLITVVAPLKVQERIESYVDNLKKNTFRQVQIEAKIIEVFFQDDSKIGIDWGQMTDQFTRSLTVDGLLSLGDPLTQVAAGFNQVWPSPTNTGIVNAVGLASPNFQMVLNALSTQGDAQVLSNPKLTVLNGQPAMISVGKSTRYIDNIQADVDADTGIITYTSESANVVEGVSFGIVASIVDNDHVILQITPVTTELDETNVSSGERIRYRSVGNGEVGLPVMNIREMTTTAEVRNNEMLVVGGLIDETETSQSNMVPGVENVPFIRYLFGAEEKKHRKRELVILLVPRLI